MIGGISNLIKLILLFVGIWREKDEVKKKALKKALHMVNEGVEKDDTSLITAGFSRAKRLR